MAKQKSIGKAELEVLQFIAKRGTSTVRQAADHFADTKGYVRPTVLKMMERLRKKGYLERETVEGVFAYRSVKPLEELKQFLVDDFVQQSLEGSVAPMVAYLMRNPSLSSAEIQRLKDLIHELEGEAE